jgi:hypothetical protein
MGNTQVTSLHPVQVGADLGTPKVVENVSANTIYYRANPAVSSALSDGNLTEGQEVTITVPTWFVTAEQVDGELEVTPIGQTFTLPETTKVGTSNLEAAAVTGPKINFSGKLEKTETALTIGTAVKVPAGFLFAVYIAIEFEKEATNSIFWVIQYEKGGGEIGQQQIIWGKTAEVGKAMVTLLLTEGQEFKVSKVSGTEAKAAKYSLVKLI